MWNCEVHYEGRSSSSTTPYYGNYLNSLCQDPCGRKPERLTVFFHVIVENQTHDFRRERSLLWRLRHQSSCICYLYPELYIQNNTVAHVCHKHYAKNCSLCMQQFNNNRKWQKFPLDTHARKWTTQFHIWCKWFPWPYKIKLSRIYSAYMYTKALQGDVLCQQIILIPSNLKELYISNRKTKLYSFDLFDLFRVWLI